MELAILNTMEIAGLTDTDMRTIPKDLREYCRTRWISEESLKVKMREILHYFHDVENLDSGSYKQYYEMLREEIEQDGKDSR